MAPAPDAIDDATLRLVLARGVGPATVARLRRGFGSDRAIVDASVAEIAERCGLVPAAADALRRALDAAAPEDERAALAEGDVALLLHGAFGYPDALLPLPDAPLALWVRGNAEAMSRPSIAIVGARRATPYGLGQAARFARGAAELGLAVVSGGAIGIDAAAHEAALRVGGTTVVVQGCGLAHAYPARHRRLFDAVASSGGAVVSDFPMAMPPRPGHFPRRNRIVAGLALAVLVVEAARRSGALITARLAAEEHGREVLALPGRVDAPASAGTNALLRSGGAALVTSPEELHEHLRLFTAWGVRARSSASRAPTADEAVVLEHLERAGGSMDMDELAARHPAPRVLAAVTGLELRGAVARQGGRVELRSTGK